MYTLYNAKACDDENTGLCQAQNMWRGETDEWGPNPLPLDNWILNDNIYTQNN
jgi:hypothetical protein